MIKILFVCTGNICRSPTAHAVANHLVRQRDLQDDFYFDSAATDSFHVGELPDFRAVSCGQKRNINFDGIFSRKFRPSDFDNFDHILCMDKSHLRKVREVCNNDKASKAKLFLEFCEVKNNSNYEVIDPYYDYDGAFDKVFDEIEFGVKNLFNIL